MRKPPFYIVTLVLFFLISATPLHFAQAQTAGLLGHWKFDETSGTTAADSSGNSRTGTLTNGPTWTIGAVGNAISLDGVNDYVSMGTALDVSALPFTLSAWVNPASYSDWATIISKRTTYSASGMRFNLDLEPGIGTVILQSYSSGLSFSYIPPLNTWTHLTVVARTGGTDLYVNGVLTQTLGAFTLGTGATSQLRIGNVPDGPDQFAGKIDEVLIYNRALTASEVSGLAQTTSPTPDTTAPTTPTNLTATAISSSQINLAWTASTDNVGVTGYNVYRGGVPVASVAATSYNDTGLTASNTYSYTVSAYDAAGKTSVQSTFASATTLSGTTPAPTVTLSTNPTSVTSGSSSTLTWSSTNATSCTASGSWTGAQITSGSQTLINLTTTGTYTLSCTGAGGTGSASVTVTVTAGGGGSASMMFQNFDGSAVPKNTGGGNYPDYYVGNNEGGVFTSSIDTTKKVSGAGSLKMHLTSGTGIYAQFNPYGPTGRKFARDYSVNPSGWQFNTYNRMRYWFFDPTGGEPEKIDGTTNYYMGTYVKAITNADTNSDEAGGGHFYHPFNVLRNTWSLCTFNSHPGHERGDPGALDSGNLPYPTTPAYGGSGDPANTYNYFDTLTRWYISGDGGATLPRDYWLDEIEFYKEPYQENDDQVYSPCLSYIQSNNRFFLSWNRPKDENNTNHEVRYAFSNIHTLGWNNAAPAPNGIISPPGYQGYNGMVYDTTAINTSGQSTIYFAIKPQNSNIFSQITFPLIGSSIPDTTVPTPPTSLTATTVSSSQINLSWTASTDNVGVTGYDIYRNGAFLVNVTTTSYANSGLSPSTSYSYYIRAKDAATNVSPQSTTVSAVTQALASVPTVTISANPTSVTSGGSSTLTWSSTNATSCTASATPANSSWTGTKVTSGSQSLTNLTTTGTYTLSCTGSGGTANASATVAVSSGGTTTDADFQARCGAAGVIFCEGFDTATSINGKISLAGDNTNQASIDTSNKASGAGSLKFNLRAGIRDANIGGAYRTLLSRQFTTGDIVYIQWRQYSPAFYYTNNRDYWGSSIKSMMFTGPNSLCQGAELAHVLSSSGYGNWPSLYTNCGSGFNTCASDNRLWTPGMCSNEVLIQQGSSLLSSPNGSGYNCEYQNQVPGDGSGRGCLYEANNKWTTYYIKWYIGPFGGNGNKIDAYYSVDGGPYKQYQRAEGIPFVNNRDDYFQLLSLETYMTELGRFGSPSPVNTYVLYDEAIVSTQPIAAPGSTTLPPSTKFSLNDRVQTTANLNVRATASQTGTFLGTQTTGNLGTVIGGPTTADGFTWWNVNYDTTPDGWSAEDFLVKYTPPTPLPTVTLSASPTLVTSGQSSTLSWTSTNATSCTASGSWSGTKATSGTQSITNITTTPTYTLSCTGAGGTANTSATITVTAGADTTPPTTPTNLTATAVSTSQINLSWSASTDPLVAGQTTTGISGYRIYRSGVQIATSPTTSYANTGLTSGTTYSYRVAAVDGATPANVSLQSAQVSATTQTIVTSDTTPPTVSLSAPANTTTVSGTITVSASASDNIGVAGVQFKLDNGNLGAEDTTSPYSMSWNTTSATNGFHTILAVARDAAGNRATSTGATIIVSNTTPDTTNPTVTITAPTTLPTYTAPTGTVTLGGTATDNIGVTKVSWSNSAGGTGTMTGTATWSATLTLQSGLNTITVTGRDAAGNFSTDVIAITYTPTIIDTQVPTKPANLSGTSPGTSQIDLAWSPSTDNVGVTGYRVYANNIQIATTTGTTYAHTNLSPFTTYAYAVEAFDAAGNTSALPSSFSVTTQAQAVIPPSSSGTTGGTTSGGGNTSSGGTTSTSTGGGTTISGTTISGTASTSGTTSAPPSVSGLTNAQVQAILSLLSSFGADDATVTNIRSILSGTSAPTAAPSSAPSGGTGFSFTHTLYQGLRSTEVTKLQQFLAKDRSLYPEGLITGYYGFLTVKAVKRFQTKYGIVSSGTAVTTGYGVVGPKTRAKLNELVDSTSSPQGAGR